MAKGRKPTKKQDLFCKLIIAGRSQAEAYEKAYNPNNKSKSIMAVNGCNMMKNTTIINHMEELRKQQIEKGMASIEKIEEELSRIAFDDISNYLSFRTEKQVVAHDSDGNPVFEYQQVIEVKDSEDIDTRAVQEIQLSQQGGFKFKLYGKDSALDKLARIKGMFIERSENYNRNENLNVNIDGAEFSDKTIKEAYKTLYDKKDDNEG